MKRRYVYLITLLAGLLLTLILAACMGVFAKTKPQELFHVISDAFFVSGVVIAGLGGLFVGSNGGAFDMIGYGVRLLFDVLRKDPTKRKYKDFYAYRLSRQGHKKGFWHLVIVGLLLLAVAALFLVLYFNAV